MVKYSSTPILTLKSTINYKILNNKTKFTEIKWLPDYQRLNIASGKLDIKDFVETFPMSKINEVFQNTLEHKYDKRSVLVPDF